MKVNLMALGLLLLGVQVWAGNSPSKGIEKVIEEEKKVATIDASGSEGKGPGAAADFSATIDELVVIEPYTGEGSGKTSAQTLPGSESMNGPKLHSPKWIVTVDGATIDTQHSIAQGITQAVSVVSEGLQKITKESLTAPSQCEDEKGVEACKARFESIHDQIAKIDDALDAQGPGYRDSRLSDVQLREETKRDRTTGCAGCKRWLARCQAALKRGARDLYKKCCRSASRETLASQMSKQD